jgi:hypothetical protein
MDSDSALSSAPSTPCSRDRDEQHSLIQLPANTTAFHEPVITHRRSTRIRKEVTYTPAPTTPNLLRGSKTRLSSSRRTTSFKSRILRKFEPRTTHRLAGAIDGDVTFVDTRRWKVKLGDIKVTKRSCAQCSLPLCKDCFSVYHAHWECLGSFIFSVSACCLLILYTFSRFMRLWAVAQSIWPMRTRKVLLFWPTVCALAKSITYGMEGIVC